MSAYPEVLGGLARYPNTREVVLGRLGVERLLVLSAPLASPEPLPGRVWERIAHLDADSPTFEPPELGGTQREFEGRVVEEVQTFWGVKRDRAYVISNPSSPNAGAWVMGWRVPWLRAGDVLGVELVAFGPLDDDARSHLHVEVQVDGAPQVATVSVPYATDAAWYHAWCTVRVDAQARLSDAPRLRLWVGSPHVGIARARVFRHVAPYGTEGHPARAALKAVTRLEVAPCGLDDAGLARLVALAPNVEALDVTGNALTPESVPVLAGLARLKWLRIERNPEVSSTHTGALEARGVEVQIHPDLTSWEALEGCPYLPLNSFTFQGELWWLVDQLNPIADAERFAVHEARDVWRTRQVHCYPIDKVRRRDQGVEHEGGYAEWEVRGLVPGRPLLVVHRTMVVRSSGGYEVFCDGQRVFRGYAELEDRRWRWRNRVFVVPGDAVLNAQVTLRVTHRTRDHSVSYLSCWFYQPGA